MNLDFEPSFHVVRNKTCCAGAPAGIGRGSVRMGAVGIRSARSNGWQLEGNLGSRHWVSTLVSDFHSDIASRLTLWTDVVEGILTFHNSQA
jgi:hypothetical protein